LQEQKVLHLHMEKKSIGTTEIKPIDAKIVAVTTLKAEKMTSDSILCGFEYKGKKIAREFISPFLNDENIKLWRKITLAVLLNKKPATINDAGLEFEKYKSQIMNQTVIVTYDADDESVFGIGKTDDNMFFPAQYNLWDTAE